LRRCPAAAAVLSRSAAHLAEAQAGIDAGLRRDLNAARDGDALSAPLLRRMQAARQLAVLRAFIETAGVRPPPAAKLMEALRQILLAGADKMPAIVWSEHALRRYRDRVYLTSAWIEPVAARAWDIRADSVCELGTGHGRLLARPCAGGLDPRRLPDSLQIRSRRAARTRSVRHLFQEHAIVPWMRNSIPLILADATLVAVADLWSEPSYRCHGGQTGIAFDWEAAPPIL
jgi:tRNA(Ile)-lysidine synthase